MPTKRNTPTTKTKKNLRGVVKKKTTTPAGTRVKQKTKPNGKQKIKGSIKVKGRNKKLTLRDKGVTRKKL